MKVSCAPAYAGGIITLRVPRKGAPEPEEVSVEFSKAGEADVDPDVAAALVNIGPAFRHVEPKASTTPSPSHDTSEPEDDSDDDAGEDDSDDTEPDLPSKKAPKKLKFSGVLKRK